MAIARHLDHLPKRASDYPDRQGYTRRSFLRFRPRPPPPIARSPSVRPARSIRNSGRTRIAAGRFVREALHSSPIRREPNTAGSQIRPDQVILSIGDREENLVRNGFPFHIRTFAGQKGNRTLHAACFSGVIRTGNLLRSRETSRRCAAPGAWRAINFDAATRVCGWITIYCIRPPASPDAGLPSSLTTGSMNRLPLAESLLG